jgi:hypothetical protein
MNKRYTLTRTLLLLTAGICAAPSYAQNFSWVKSGGLQGYAVTTDASHNTIAVGTYNGLGQFGTTSLPLYGMRDCFVVKYDAGGNVLWARGFGGNANDIAMATAADAAGNIYVSGYFLSSNALQFTANDSLTQSGSNSLFLAKYDASGNFQWAKKGTLGGPQHSDAAALHVDASGNIIMGGAYNNSVTFGTTTLAGGTTNLYLYKFSNTGNVVWARSGTSTGDCQLLALTTDAAGNIYATGKVTTPIDWGTGMQNTPNGDQAMIAKFNSTGVLQWMKHEGNAQVAGTSTKNYDSGNGIAVDAGGNVYVGGSLLDTTYFDMTTMAMVVKQWGMIAKYNSTGVKQWLKHIGGGNEHDVINSVAIDAVGNLYVIGNYKDTMTISGTALPMASSVDIFIARLTPAGNVNWYKTAGGANADFGGDIAVDANGSVVTTGMYEFNAAFGSINLTGTGATDAFISRQANPVPEGVSHLASLNYLQIYPNPAADMIYIRNETTSECSGMIVDAAGHIMASQNIAPGISELNISSFAPGIYFLTLIDNSSQRRSQRIVKL